MSHMLNVTMASSTTWNGGLCGVCGARWLGSHTCSIEDLIRRADELTAMAVEKFDALCPEPTVGPDGAYQEGSIIARHVDEALEMAARRVEADAEHEGPRSARLIAQAAASVRRGIGGAS